MTTIAPITGARGNSNSSNISTRPKLSELTSQVSLSDLARLVETYTNSGRKSGSVLSYECPLPSHPATTGRRRTPSLMLKTSKNGSPYWRCYGACDRHGDALDFIAEMETITKGQAIKRLKSFLGIADEYSSSRNPNYVPKPKRAPQTLQKARELAPTARASVPKRPAPTEGQAVLDQYLASRGWPLETATRFGLEAVIHKGSIWIRHPFKDYDLTGKLVVTAWQDRATTELEEGVPYWNSSVGTMTLYNIEALEADGLEGVVLCEGAPDTITASLALDEYPSWVAVGVAGAGNFKPEWSVLLEGLSVVVAFDSDTAGDLASRKLPDILGRALVRKRPTANDLTDEARVLGLVKVGEWLTSGATREAIPTITLQGQEVCRICSRDSSGGLCRTCSKWGEYGSWTKCSRCRSYALDKLGEKCFIGYKCSGVFEEVVS